MWNSINLIRLIYWSFFTFEKESLSLSLFFLVNGNGNIAIKRGKVRDMSSFVFSTVLQCVYLAISINFTVSLDTAQENLWFCR